jgi:hypothetical protein
MTDDFQAMARRIESNPLGRLMYGSRELFHSNLIGWFFDMLPEVADATFRPLALTGSDSGRWVDRERGHLDLVFHWPDRAPLVIENKVFSFPDKQQLDEYEAAAGTWPQAPSLVLLSVSPPAFDPGNWRYLSYGEFAARILDALPSDSSYEVETMRRYAALVTDLHDLISAVDVHDDSEPVWLPRSLLTEISSSQMRAALHKARAQRVAHMLNEALPGLGSRRAARSPTPCHSSKRWNTSRSAACTCTSDGSFRATSSGVPLSTTTSRYAGTARRAASSVRQSPGATRSSSRSPGSSR